VSTGEESPTFGKDRNAFIVNAIQDSHTCSTIKGPTITEPEQKLKHMILRFIRGNWKRFVFPLLHLQFNQRQKQQQQQQR
jgi:hypothetical protein